MAKSGYDMYFDKCLFPVTPEKISIKINGNNKTVTLINEGEINILKKPGLTDIEFEAEIPQVKHPYAVREPRRSTSATCMRKALSFSL